MVLPVNTLIVILNHYLEQVSHLSHIVTLIM